MALIANSGWAAKTPFVYSGTLQWPDGQTPAGCDLVFSIVGPDPTQSLWQSAIYEDVPCRDGAITVTLDPEDPGLFENGPIYLQIAVRPGASTGTFNLTADRPEITWRPAGVKASRFRSVSMADRIWIAIGLLGQAFFTARFLVQWIASERARRSVVPESFWIFSVVGCTIVLAYAFYRRDPVFILAYLFNNLIYVRNLIFIRRAQQPDGDAVSPREATRSDKEGRP